MRRKQREVEHEIAGRDVTGCSRKVEIERHIICLQRCQGGGESSRAMRFAASVSVVISVLRSMRSKGPNEPELQMDHSLNTILWYIVVVE